MKRLASILLPLLLALSSFGQTGIRISDLIKTNQLVGTNVMIATIYTAQTNGTRGIYFSNVVASVLAEPTSGTLLKWSLIDTNAYTRYYDFTNGGVVTIAAVTFLTNWTAAISNLVNTKQFGDSTLTNLSGLPTNELSRYTAPLFFTNWTAAISNLVATKQAGDSTLTNLSSLATNELTRYTTPLFLTNFLNAVSNLVQTKQFGSLNLTNWSNLDTNFLTAVSNLVQTKQQGSANLTNWANLTTNDLTLKALADVADVFPGVTDSHVLHYDTASGKWTNGAINMMAIGSANPILTNLTVQGSNNLAQISMRNGAVGDFDLRLHGASTFRLYDLGSDIPVWSITNSVLNIEEPLRFPNIAATNKLMRFDGNGLVAASVFGQDSISNLISFTNGFALSNLTDVGGTFGPLQYDVLTWDAMLGKWTNGINLRTADTNFVISVQRGLSLAPNLFVQNSINIDGTNNSSIELQDVTTTNSVKFIVTNLMWNSLWWTMPATNAPGLLLSVPTGTNTANLTLSIGADHQIPFVSSGTVAWMDVASAGNGGESNATYILARSTNVLPNAIIVSKITNGSVQLPVAQAIPDVSSFPDLDTGTNAIWRLLFDSSANQTCHWGIQLPDDYGTNAQITFPFSTLAASASKSNAFEIKCMVNHPGSSQVVNVDAYNGKVTNYVAVPSTAGQPSSFAISCNLTGAVANDFIKITLTRITGITSDNSGQTAIHANPLFQYTRR